MADKPEAPESHATEQTQQGSVELVNASGHAQELSRNFSLVSLAGVGLVVGNVWPAIGGSILVAIFNGGPPGVLYEFITVSVFYWIVAASVAELASAIPSSAGVYHWATITPGKRWGRMVGFFAGYWNCLAWILGAASMTFIFSNTVVQMYALKHADFVSKPWHVFVTYIIVTWVACAIVCFCNSAMPRLNEIGIFFILAGFLITLVVVTVMPGMDGRPGHASSSFVWTEWTADIGYPDGFVFVAGMLNGAFSVGTPDTTSHLAEEIPYPQRNVPIAILCQMSIGFITGLAYLVAILYAINDYDALFTSPYPIAEIYRQATGSANGAIGLLTLVLICIGICVCGLYITSGRTLWALARDGATPLPKVLSQVSHKLEMPFNATVTVAVLVTVLGAIYVGSTTAFNAFVGSFVLMSSSSYVAAILPHLLTRRRNIEVYGPFRLKGALGFVFNAISCAYLLVWFVIYCFPFSLPTNAQSMNYACLIWGGCTVFVALWWLFVARHGYEGPPAVMGGQVTVADTLKPVHGASRKASVASTAWSHRHHGRNSSVNRNNSTIETAT
ncbi:Choline transport protein [Exophiala dermatitidis]